MIEVTTPQEIDSALFEYNKTLTAKLLAKIRYSPKTTVVEIGAGAGCFTIPLVGELNDVFKKLYCIDSYTGPYKNDVEKLNAKLADMDIMDRVEIITCDARELDKKLNDVDMIIGHELLCELNKEQIKEILTVSYHALNTHGIFIHSDLAPIAQSRAEELVQIANEYSAEPISDANWFSPTANDLVEIAIEVGFRIINVDYIKIPIKFTKNAALELIERWKTKSEFLNKYHDEVYNIGLEYPMEQILCCRKIE